MSTQEIAIRLQLRQLMLTGKVSPENKPIFDNLLNQLKECVYPNGGNNTLSRMPR